MTSANPLVFYDISSPLQPRSYAPNPSKARLALSFKAIPFTTSWVDILDIPSVRSGLNCAATRKLDDGSDYYTLPMVRDPSSGKVWGDTFDIANALDDMYPESGGGRLFPENSTRKEWLSYQSPHKDMPFYAPLTTNVGARNAEYAQFNLHVDATFTAHAILVAQDLPFNPATAEAAKALFSKRAHLTSWDDLVCQGEMREQKKAAFKESLGSLAQLFMVHADGPFLDGEKANYADLIVGGWLNYYAMLLKEEEWREVRTWHGGVFARLHDVLQEKYFVCE